MAFIFGQYVYVFFGGIWLAEKSKDSFVLSNLFHVCMYAISFENFNEFQGWHSWFGTTQESKLEDVFFSIHSVISISFSDFGPGAPGKTM